MATGQSITLKVSRKQASEIYDNGTGKELVNITCLKCGEHFKLRAVLVDLELDAGFKTCLCGNTDPKHFEIKIAEKVRKFEPARQAVS